MKKNSPSALSSSQKRMLVFGALLFCNQKSAVFSFSTDKERRVHLRKEYTIIDKESAVKVLGKLLNLEEANTNDIRLLIDNAELNLIKTAIAKGLRVKKEEIDKVSSTYAWDVCRLVSISKWCFCSGYISKQEMWDPISEGVEIASERGTNWEAYTISFLLGRTIQGLEINDIINESKYLYYSKGPLFRRIKDINVYRKYKFKYSKVIKH